MGERTIIPAFAARLPRCRLSAIVASIVVFAIAVQGAAAQSTSAQPGALPAEQRVIPLPPCDTPPGQAPQDPGSQHVNPDIRLTSGTIPPPVGDDLAAPPLPRFSGSGADYGRRTLAPDTEPLNLKPAPLEPADLEFPINLATALRLSDARPVIVNAAQASAWVAEAQLQRAKLIKIPEFDFGVDYARHDGPGPDFNHGVSNSMFVPGQGGILDQNLNWMYIGGSFYMITPLTDAIFQPLAARQNLNARRFDIQTAKNDALLATALAYFNVHKYRGQYAGAVDVVERGELLLGRVVDLSKDLVPRVEVQRAVNMLADMQQHATLARQQWRVASANLTQILRLDPRVIVSPLESDHLQITLIDLNRPLDDLMPIALEHRPELSAQQANVRGAAVLIRQEKCRPLLPTFLLTGFQSPGGMRMQGMIFGIGQGNKMDLWSLREDVSAQFVWQLDAMGFGNMALIKKQRGVQSQAIVTLFQMQDAIVAEVTESQANLQSAALRVSEADRSLREALITYDGNYRGLAQTKRFGNVLVQVYRPQEVVKALENLQTAYDNYFATVAEYNRAQFALFHALGYPAREVAALRPPGEVTPVDTNRPAYLPPVGVGPPPATR